MLEISYFTGSEDASPSSLSQKMGVNARSTSPCQFACMADERIPDRACPAIPEWQILQDGALVSTTRLT